MKNPLRDMSRPKALGLAGLAAGALTVSAAAAAMNVGLLTSEPEPAFAPTPVVQTGDVEQPTPTTEAPVEIVYQDVYDIVSAGGGSSAPVAAPAPPAPAGSTPSGSDDGAGSDDSMDDDADESHEDESGDELDHESEDHESEDHESEAHELDDDGHDD
jgi:hypothetical protein